MTNPEDMEPICQATDEYFYLRCGEKATVVGSLGEQWGYLCSDCANRAIEHGWVIGPTVQDIDDFLSRLND